jgi:hypothetical protein
MAQPLTAGLPPGLNLVAGYKVRFAALDPTTGAAVSGVKVANPTIYVENLTGNTPAALASGPFTLVAGPAG